MKQTAESIREAQQPRPQKPTSITFLQWIYFLAATAITVYFLYFAIIEIKGLITGIYSLKGSLPIHLTDVYLLVFSLTYFFIFAQLFAYSEKGLKNARKANLFAIAIILLSCIVVTTMVLIAMVREYASSANLSDPESSLNLEVVLLVSAAALIYTYACFIPLLIIGIIGHFILRNNLKQFESKQTSV